MYPQVQQFKVIPDGVCFRYYIHVFVMSGIRKDGFFPNALLSFSYLHNR